MGQVAIGIRKNAWDNANGVQRTILRWCVGRLDLGVPAEYEQPNGTRWYVFHDSRIELLDVAVLGTVVKGLAQFSNYRPTSKAQAKADVEDYVRSRIVLPKDVALTEIVQVEVPVRVQVEVPVTDVNGDPTGEFVLVWRDHPTDTRLVDVEQSLGDAPALVLAAQGAPGVVAAGSFVPAGWVAVGGDV